MKKRRIHSCAAEKLAEQMLGVLQAQRRADVTAYPLTLDRLVQLTDASIDPALVREAASTSHFRSRTITADPNRIEAPLVLQEDIERLADSPLTIDFAFERFKSRHNRIFTTEQLQAKLTVRLRFREAFQVAIERQIATQRLPSHVGWVYAGRKPSLFLIADLNPPAWRQHILAAKADLGTTSPPGTRSPSPSTESQNGFANLFEAAFQRLDRQYGSRNLVHLYDLRRALPSFSREQFDSELRKLRLAGDYSLSGGESRQAINGQQREAGIREAGSLLLHVSRSTP